MKRPKMKATKPKALKGPLKQTEGFTPNEAISPGKKAGMLSSKKARAKRLENMPM